ncbi:Sphingomyelin phosphodiesterase [Entamoeba marina]
MADTADYTFKVLIIGEPSVGKTAMMERYCENIFHEELISTIGVDFNSKLIKLDDLTVKLQLWDTAGQERFRNVTSSYYRGTQGCLVVYDVSDEESFERITHWVQEYQNEQEIAFIIIVGNKTDLPPKITNEMAEEAAKKTGYLQMRCSAKTGDGINQIFETLAKGIYNNKEIMANLPKKSGITVVDPKKSGPCC